ncbi:MAG: FtsX-like permease family protein, partial [Bacteroidota bacterium]
NNVFRFQQYIVASVGLTLIVGLLSGFYPAFILSSFKTVAVLKNAHQKIKGLSFRRILVTLQFAISVFLIIGTFVALSQLQFLQGQDTGFDQENVLMVPVIRSPIGQHYETFRNNALQSTHIKSVTAVEEVVGAKHQVGNYQFEAMERSKPYPRFFVRHDFTETMNIELAAGRDYSRDIVTDDSLAYVINESMVRALGWESPEEAIGKRFYFRQQLQGEVIGVVKDYNFISKHHSIGPLVIDLNTRAGAFNLFIKYVAVKVDGNNINYAIDDLEKAWKSVLPDRPFDFFFLDDRLNNSYKAEQKLSQITVVFSAMAIFVACLGLFGLVTFSVERRTKEIGVRKVLGINTPQILILLSKEFIYLIVIAILVAIPVSYFLLDLWLESFAYRVTLSAWPFMTAAFLAIMVSVVTVIFQALKASALNPARTLKHE